MLSVLIPARNEIYLEKTIRNVLENARGDIEVLAVLDGYLPEPQINIGDERVIFYHFEKSIGQRQSTNYAAKKARGQYLMKLDAHCAVDEGFDVKLAQDYSPDWTVVPRMYNLDIKTWKPKRHKRTDYMYFSSPNHKEAPFRAQYFNSRQPRGPDIDDTMCCMGPGWFLSKDRYWYLGGMDEGHGGWGQMGIEVALKAWLSGGSFKVNKKTWFAHWFRGGSGPGFPYKISGNAQERARQYSQDLWINNKWPLAKRKLSWVIKKFKPPTWENYMLEEKNVDKEVEKARTLAHRIIRRVFQCRTAYDFSPIGTKMNNHYHCKREQLIDVWKEAGYKFGIEIGVSRGYFSHYILENSEDIHLHCIDPWEVYFDSRLSQDGQNRNYKIASERIKPYIENGRAKLFRNYSMDKVNDYKDGELDFVFIDGAHDFDNIMLDLIHWSPKVRLGGMVAAHDYLPMRRGGVMTAVDAYTKCHKIEPWFVVREAVPTAFWIR